MIHQGVSRPNKIKLAFDAQYKIVTLTCSLSGFGLKGHLPENAGLDAIPDESKPRSTKYRPTITKIRKFSKLGSSGIQRRRELRKYAGQKVAIFGYGCNFLQKENSMGA